VEAEANLIQLSEQLETCHPETLETVYEILDKKIIEIPYARFVVSGDPGATIPRPSPRKLEKLLPSCLSKLL